MAEPVSAATLRAQTPPGAVDPNVKIPRHVLEAGKRSEEIQRQVLGIAEPSVAEAVAKAAAAAAGGGEPPAEPPDANAPPVTPPSNEPPAQPAQQEGAPQEQVPIEVLYKRLQGRNANEAKRHREQMTLMSQRLEHAEREIQTLRATVQSPLPDPPAGASLITEQEINDYGPELVDIIRRAAAETAGPLNNEIARLRAQMGHVQQETGNAFLSRMNTTIGASVPNWDSLNRDPRFIEWSQLPDVFSGSIRKTLMQEAWNSGDAHRVIAFFQAFLAEEAALHPSGGNGHTRSAPRTVVGDQSILPPAAPAGNGMDLANLASPGRAHSAGGSPAEKPVYTTAEITKFYTDVASGKWRGREQHQAAIDADIILAQREGRIIVNQRTQLPVDSRIR